jgi:hypothetical protein
MVNRGEPTDRPAKFEKNRVEEPETDHFSGLSARCGEV